MLISQHGIKRELKTDRPFNLCLTRDEARMLCEQLASKCADNAAYGWVIIYPFQWVDGPNPSTSPLKWTDEGNVNPPSRTGWEQP